MNEFSNTADSKPIGLIRRRSSRVSDFCSVVWMDAVLLIILLTGAFFYLRTTPEFAANLPQDASDYAYPAVELLEKGELSLNRFGHSEPPAHPFGVPLLLLPSYIIFGHFLGNGIYSILFCALGSVVAVYFIARQFCGPIGGCLAGIFLITHHGFHDFSQKIMSEVPSIFVFALIFLAVLHLAKRECARLSYIAVGALVGVAFSLRAENILILAAVGGSFLVDTRKNLAMRWVWLVIGLTPWLLATGLYNHLHFGSPFRTAFSLPDQWGVDQFPVFSKAYLTKQGYLNAHGYAPQCLMDGNFVAHFKTFLCQVDNTQLFMPAIWANRPQQQYATLVVLRSLLGLLGVGWCFREWRRQPRARILGIWFVALSFMLMTFFMFFFWQEARYLLRLVPFFCVLNAIGVIAILTLIDRWPLALPKEKTFAVTILTCALVGLLTYYSVAKLVPQSDDNLLLYESLRRAGSVMESNAVVVTNWDTVRPDAYVIRGTQRMLLPLTGWDDHAPFVVAKSSDKLLSLMLSGRPAYLLLRNPFDWQLPPSELLSLQSLGFRFEPIITVTLPDGQPIGAYVYRVRFDRLPFVISP